MPALSLARNKEAVLQISYLNKQTRHSKSVCLLSFKWQDLKKPTGKSMLKPIMLASILLRIRTEDWAIMYKSSSLGLVYRIFVFSHLTRSCFPLGLLRDTHTSKTDHQERVGKDAVDLLLKFRKLLSAFYT